MRWVFFLSLIVVSWQVGGLNAAVFERDLVPGSGDGLLTYDDVNQREWLDLTETILADFRGKCTTFECVYQNVIAETMPGGMFAGFMAAGSDDVIELAQSAGIDTSTLEIAINEISTRNLIDLLQQTYSTSGNIEGTIGLLGDPLSSEFPARLVAIYGVTPPTLQEAGLEIRPISDIGGDNPASLMGVFLYRNAIPEPTSLVLTCAFLLLFSFRRKGSGCFAF